MRKNAKSQTGSLKPSNSMKKMVVGVIDTAAKRATKFPAMVNTMAFFEPTMSSSQPPMNPAAIAKTVRKTPTSRRSAPPQSKMPVA